MSNQRTPTPRPTRRAVLAAGATGLAVLAAPFVNARAQAKVTLKFGSVEGMVDNPLYDADKWFAEECTRRSGGALTVTYFPNGQLGAQRDLVEGLKLGTVDIVGAATALVSGYVPEMAIFDLPYVFTSKAKLYGFLDGPDGRQLLDAGMARGGLRGLAFYDAGVRCIYNAQRRVRTVADLKGLKIRVEENPIRVGSFNAMGAQATPMAYSEVYNGIQQRVVDGFENAPTIFVSGKFYEVAKFAAKTEHFITPAIRLMGKPGWDKLPAEMKTLITAVAAEATAMERKQWAASEAKVWDDIAKLGVTVDEADKDGFKKSVEAFVARETAKLDKAWVEKVARAAG